MPNCGSAIRREKNSSVGVWKKLAFSMKKGRRSGKVTSYRWLMVTCGSSDSTWLKSGLSATSRANWSWSTSFESRPPRSSSRSLKPGSFDSMSRNRERVEMP